LRAEASKGAGRRDAKRSVAEKIGCAEEVIEQRKMVQKEQCADKMEMQGDGFCVLEE